MKKHKIHVLVMRNAMLFFLTASPQLALAQAYAPLGQPSEEPVGGQPPTGANRSIEDFDYQLKYQRAFETAVWSMPAVVIYRMRDWAFEELGAENNTIFSYSETAGPNLEVATSNSSTPYIGGYTDLKNGPVLLEVPASGADGTLYGQVVDARQFTIADIGPSGMDKGQASKYLFTPPGYTGEVPEDHLHVASPNYRIAFAFRSVVLPGKTQRDAFDYAHRLKMYYLSEAADPPEQKFIDPSHDRYAGLPRYDERYFDDVYQIFSVEPVREEDKVMMGMLASLGIQQGKPYTPDETAKRAMRQATIDVWYHIQDYFDNLPADRLYWPDRHYTSLLMSDERRRFEYNYPDRIDTIPRAAQFAWCTYVPVQMSDSPATQYLVSMADKNGSQLDAGKTYKVDVPKDVPVKQFWALTVYDRATFSFIYTPDRRTTLSSYDLSKMKSNSDGSVSIFVGPKAPAGMESNWINTAGKRPMPMFRFYSPEKALNDKTFKMPDFEVIDP
ncbi:hypothetical protein Pla22_33940 [Rubripirellula amarantea]|uniref:DUF1254 domain-containing protein n=1 Tax=Rubripirellula amarantea TaxID=2527999 RepID=A0A5C5WKT5_9BACT|nr:DUF1214 domain-containing protein [Rubripirellula amarantea]TWT50651.1 hypothetical protein Pla22_33940 [Rubripirellula amarantea]